MSVSALFNAANELLVAASQACVLSPGGAMSRVYVSPSVPPWDCPDQLTVHAGGAAEADTAPLQPPMQPMHRIEAHILLPLVQLTITALRCAPVLQQREQTLVLPPTSDLDQTSMETLGDLWAIWNHIATLKRDLTLFPPRERELIFDAAIPLNTEGGIVGWQIPIRVQVDGFATV